jgi:hypothetical protein
MKLASYWLDTAPEFALARRGASVVVLEAGRALPWPAIPGHTGKPWFLPIVVAWYRFLDWVR